MLTIPPMAKRLSQTEINFRAWMKFAKAAPARPVRKPSGGEPDSGMTAWCQEITGALGLVELAKKVQVTWNPRMRTTAGRAWWPARAIELNPKLKDFSQNEVWRTLKHELAHLIAYERAGRRKIAPHGAEWQDACAELGIAGESTYHSLPLKGRKMKRNYSYACPSCLAVVLRVRPIKRAVACHACCKKFNNGKYHDRFRLIKNDL